MGWKRTYVKWYRIAEEVLAGSIPVLDDDEVARFVSQNNWLIIPTSYERDRKDSIVRSDPNIYFDLSEEGKMHIGFTCNTLESVRRMRNLLRGFHKADRDSLISELQKLDGSFRTRVDRKIKEHYFMQTPEYETEFEFPTNMMNDDFLSKAFETIDRIMEESDRLLRHEGKSWRTLAPTLEIAHTIIERDEDQFRYVLKQLKPVYQIALRVRTDKEIDAEILRREKKKKQEKQRKYREFIERLKAQGVHGKEWREAVVKWKRENP